MRQVIAVAIMSFIAGLAPSVYAAGEGTSLDKTSTSSSTPSPTTQTATEETSPAGPMVIRGDKGAGREETQALTDARAKLKSDKDAIRSDEAVLKDAQDSGDAIRISDAQKKLKDDQALEAADRQKLREAKGGVGIGETGPAGTMRSGGNASEEKGGM